MAAYTASKTAHSVWLKAFALRSAALKSARHRRTTRAHRNRSGKLSHIGVAPSFPAGMTPQHVVNTIWSAVEAGANEVASTDF
jgi:hypothetical protein